MPEERTIAVAIRDDDGNRVTRHFNVDNIAYLRSYTHSFTTFTWLLIALGAAVLFGIAYSFLGSNIPAGTDIDTSGQAALAALAPLVLIWILVSRRRPDQVAIGTVTKNHAYVGESITQLETKFADAALEVQTLANDLSDKFTTEMYRYHFVPDNVVSVAHERGRTIPVPLILYGTAVLCGAAGILLETQYETTQVGIEGGLVVATLFGIAGVVADPYRIPDTLRVELQSGDSQHFAMRPEDCRSFIESYQRRQ